MTPPRRFRLSRPPDGPAGPEVVVRQVFWRLGDGFVLRLRREGPAGEPSEDTLTVRGPAGVEWAVPLTTAPESVGALFRAGAGHRVVALRRRHRLDGRDWDVDDYQWENAGLVLARPLADNPRPPRSGRDVTAEPAYDEENLAYAPFTTWPAPSR